MAPDLSCIGSLATLAQKSSTPRGLVNYKVVVRSVSGGAGLGLGPGPRQSLTGYFCFEGVFEMMGVDNYEYKVEI